MSEMDFEIQREKRKMDRTIRGCEFDDLQDDLDTLKKQVYFLETTVNKLWYELYRMQGMNDAKSGLPPFWKRCGSCGEVFGSNDINEFWELLRTHVCKKKVNVKARAQANVKESKISSVPSVPVSGDTKKRNVYPCGER